MWSLLEFERLALLWSWVCVGSIWWCYRLGGFVCKCANVQGTTWWPCGCNNDMLPKGMAPGFSILAMQNIFLKNDAVLFKEISLEMNAAKSHILYAQWTESVVKWYTGMSQKYSINYLQLHTQCEYDILEKQRIYKQLWGNNQMCILSILSLTF